MGGERSWCDAHGGASVAAPVGGKLQVKLMPYGFAVLRAEQHISNEHKKTPKMVSFCIHDESINSCRKQPLLNGCALIWELR